MIDGVRDRTDIVHELITVVLAAMTINTRCLALKEEFAACCRGGHGTISTHVRTRFDGVRHQVAQNAVDLRVARFVKGDTRSSGAS